MFYVVLSESMYVISQLGFMLFDLKVHGSETDLGIALLDLIRLGKNGLEFLAKSLT